MKTYQAFLLSVAVLVAGFVFATFFPTAPYATFAGTLGLVFVGYAGKRLMQKKEGFIDKND